MGYPGKVLERYENDNGPMCEGYNCDCENHAIVTIQGETDSFGYETIDLCESCWNKMQDDSRDHEEEIRHEEQNIAPKGMLWLFTATRQDDCDWYASAYTDRANCVLAQERAENKAAAYGGLYCPTIELVSVEKAHQVLHEHARRFDIELDIYEEEED